MKSKIQIKSGGEHILIAEDSPTQAEQLKLILESRGYRVTVAINGKLALAAARKHRPAFVISDIVMPEMNGYALCKAIKSDDALKDIPVVLVTTLSDPKDIVDGLECGADNFIRKPYDEHYLLSRIGYILMRRELRKSERMQMGVEINLGGHKYFITSERQQILDLLISTYEQAVHLNEELKARQQELANRTAQLEAINKELESFSYAVSHDLRAPLRHIDGFSQSLVEDCAGSLPPVGVEHLGRIRAAVKRMSELIEDLLQLSRVTRGEMKHESVNLSELAVAVLEELQRTQPERTVTRAVATGLVAEGDQRLIRVVLDNLLGNAWKYTQKCAAPVIEFGMTERDGVRTYYVKDNGAGFDMAYVGKLFAPFQRLHTVEEFPGTGIGLATVQRIIHRHGGRIWADGAVGQGATFSFTLG